MPPCQALRLTLIAVYGQLRYHAIGVLLLIGQLRDRSPAEAATQPIDHHAIVNASSAIYSATADIHQWISCLKLAAWLTGRFAELHNRQPGFFFRLSTRSPKDAAMNRTGFSATEQAIGRLLRRYYPVALGLEASASVETHVGQVSQHLAAIQHLLARTPADVLTLLVDSKRLMYDVRENELLWEARHPWYQSLSDSGLLLALREWQPICPDLELRLFVRSGVVTAICPTVAYCVFPWRPASAWEAMARSAMAYFSDVLRARLPVADCIIDVAFIPGMDEDSAASRTVHLSASPGHQLMSLLLEGGSAPTTLPAELAPLNEVALRPLVVEVNAFGSLLSDSLFCWDKDQDLLYCGPVELRCRVLEDVPHGLPLDVVHTVQLT
ncbi:hypothetical protein H696_04891 [Fonticula alba]|uniref:Uncharacterized protein n=1 Tax=Fonticula alba TaxID=691883 RepID=A0A058Z2U4_FONAL|nr:hypothetical protein H696_04891 [Fonticula alba]KCV68599.1 hypothetical protein H696_04891 [Fonticula alba]|eukprot:XP_009497031.1 hypothetical protein H696_04891 [Fonticula alba]